MRCLRIIISAIAIVTLSACSTQLGYRFADTLVEWKIGEFVQLDKQQEQHVDQAIAELHYWHATSELPFYASQLQILRDKIAEQSLTPADITAVYDSAFIAWQRAMVKFEPYAVSLLPQLTDEQIAQIQAKMAEQLQSERDELAELGSAQELQARTYKRAHKNMRDWVRRTTPLQERLLQQWSQAREPTRELWLDYNEQWHQAFLSALENRHQPEVFAEQITRLFFHSQQFYSDALAENIEANRDMTMILFYELYQSLTAKQRRRVVAKLDDYINDFNQLAAYFEKRGPQ